MNFSKVKLFLSFFILLAYVSIGVFGLFQFMHTTDMPMADCPYAQNGYSICENSLAHVNNWQQFSNATFVSLTLLSLLVLGVILYFLNARNLLDQEKYFYKWKYYLYSQTLYTAKGRIIKWLSLFENSPSLEYVRHS